MADLRVVLFFTRGASLKTWHDVGMLDREVALYRRLQESGVQVTFVTYGDARDMRLARQLEGIRVICNRWQLPQPLYVGLLTRFYPMSWGSATVFKSNQVLGADIALKAARRFGRKFVARCGYLHSEFTERRHGDSSSQAKQKTVRMILE